MLFEHSVVSDFEDSVFIPLAMLFEHSVVSDFEDSGFIPPPCYLSTLLLVILRTVASFHRHVI